MPQYFWQQPAIPVRNPPTPLPVPPMSWYRRDDGLLLPRLRSDLIRGESLILPVPAAGGGYNNLTNWPGIGLHSDTPNRPVYTNGVLSWIGPVGGGPSTSSDIAQTLALTRSGIVSTSANGQVISGLAIINASGSPALSINHNNVTVRNCYIISTGYPGGIAISQSTSGTLIEDCEIFCGGVYATGNYCIGGPGVGVIVNTIARRLNIHGGIKSFGQGINGCTIIDCYSHGMAGSDCNHIAAWCPGSLQSTNCLVQHNYFDGVDRVVNSIGTLGSITGGSGYTPGTYYNIPLTGGSGGNATADIVVNGSGVVSSVTLRNPGYNYVNTNTLSASASYIGPGSGFSIPVSTVIASNSFESSALDLTNYGSGGGVNTINMQNCAMALTNSTHQILCETYTSTPISGVVTNNSVVSCGFFGSQPYGSTSLTMLADNSNFVMATALATSGSALNGTGVW